ncbi:heavy metal-binding domain-containing protein [Asticcacaulis sp.]|uniref:heavy metal-binding domain-containing protein n=1 Tax=Asticcacaulis sp. TaxID=1872648 RepID=UPI003F7C5822
MHTQTRRNLLATVAAGIGAWSTSGRSATVAYICPPCGCAADGQRFTEKGLCPACGMALVPLPSDVLVPFEPDALETGRGRFEMAAGPARPGVRIVVHYYKPQHLTPDSPIIIVLAGAGRNADTYRDAWIGEADRANVLVAAPAYPESIYDIAAYQMGGTVKDFVVHNMPPDAGTAPHIYLRDEDIVFSVNPDRRGWIFEDFDRLYGLLVAMTGSRRTHYDLFGHSAGGQVLHRHVLFHPQSRADRIVAANAGLYTLPDLKRTPLLGMAGTGVTEHGLRASLAQKLIILAGETDIAANNGGSLLHTPLIDRTGIDRLARARYFYKYACDAASRLGVPLAWTLEMVPDTGHDYRTMSTAAGRRLFPPSSRA